MNTPGEHTICLKRYAFSVNRGRMFSRAHLLQTLMHAIQIAWGYSLMLVFMTYNVYLCLSLVLGATLGYFVAGWSRTQITDQNEHCH